MCGLVGVAGKLDLVHRKAFKKLLQIDTYRGPHSTGVFTYKDGKSFVDKCTGTPWDFEDFFIERFTNGVPDFGAKVLMGHNRWATVGKITPENAHPFKAGNIIGVHNGTLTKYHLHNIDNHYKYDTDSEALLNMINDKGIKNTYPHMHGAWSLVWFDKETEKLQFVRNEERPMYIAFVDDRQAIMWASEKWMIEVVCDMYKINIVNISATDVDHVYSYSLKPKKGKGYNKIYKGKKLKSYEPKYKWLQEREDNWVNDSYVFGRGVVNNVGKNSGVGYGGIDRSQQQKIEKERKDLWVSFYIDERTEYNSFTGYTIENEYPMKVYIQDSEVKHWMEDKGFMGYFFGKVLFVEKDTSTEEGSRLVIQASTVSEMYTWDTYPWIINHCGTDYVGASKSIELELATRGFISIHDYVHGDKTKYYDIDGAEYTEEEVKDFLNTGCGNCTHQEDIENFKDVYWLPGTKAYLCSSCAKDDDVKQMCSVN